ncbi:MULTISPECIES: ABC transporter substrate-binding protein [unclassified Polaromonas]|uniref:ABC transporter substrate-binding protein n=2 Tax=Polaromonas TaxID=52972 RepID=UPI0018CB4BA0|nr:branched-chain amino acid transport system substrate-binding protein [Polaromonas sp. CG_9.7]MBG6113787.1 branched-chain amino acid transport system substrate-binding protein [Polaromonas sp. CG_9.2]MDH6184313.1 branched-chain amino acid transport system substrate-binding protein [Polaromonas sp. CG_23.6]
MIIRRQFTQIATALALGGMLVSVPVFAQEVVKIGFSGPLSGGAAQYGKNTLDGLKFAIDELNTTGFEVAGKKVKFEVVALDDKYNPSETAINFQRLVQESKTPVVMCPHSGGGYAIQTSNERLNALLLSYTSVPKITQSGNKLTFRIPPDFSTYIKPFVSYAMKKFGKNLAIVNADHDYAKAWTALFKPAWEAAGGKIVADNPMSYNRSTDFYSGVSKALAGKPDVLFIGGASEPTGLVAKQARELGFKGGFVIMDQAKMNEMKPIVGSYAALEGAIGVLPVIDDPQPAVKAFVERWMKVYPGREPGSEATYNYTAMIATAHAMKLAGTTTDAMAIRGKLNAAIKALPAAQNLANYEGIDANGGSMMDTLVGVIEGGKVKEVKLSDLVK